MSIAAPLPRRQRPRISVIVCTHNRADMLRDAVTSVLAQGMSDDDWELLIVDNASTDTTQDVVRSLSADRRIRCVAEGTLGLCHARNTGWRAAEGAFVAYLDDDATAETGWLDAIRQGFSAEPQPGLIGGRILPKWEAERPPWLSDEIAHSLGIIDWGSEPKAITDLHREWLGGGNMGVPVARLEELGGFHPRLGRVGAILLSSEEVHLQRAVLRRGHSCVYLPAMAIRHRIPASRLSKAWFERRFYWQGVSDAIMDVIDTAPPRPVRVARGLRRAAAFAASPRRLASLVRPDETPHRFTQKCFALIELGRIAGLLGVVRH